MEPLTGAFHDALTGKTIVRKLTDEELQLIPQIPPTDENNDAEQSA